MGDPYDYVREFLLHHATQGQWTEIVTEIGIQVVFEWEDCDIVEPFRESFRMTTMRMRNYATGGMAARVYRQNYNPGMVWWEARHPSNPHLNKSGNGPFPYCEEQADKALEEFGVIVRGKSPPYEEGRLPPTSREALLMGEDDGGQG